MEDRNSRSGNFAIGIDIKYLDSIFDVNYNGIYGREEYTGFELFRMYNNLSIVAEILKDLKVGMELNSIGIESEPVKKATSRVMNTISFNSKYNFIKDFSLALRYAMTDNQDNLFFIPQKVSNDIAIALEYKPSTKSFIRFEVRNITLDGTFRDLYFSSENEITNSRTDISINFGMVFDRLIKE
jgi:hypothetical protein